MDTVSFTEMQYGTKEDYELLREREKEYLQGTPDRILRELSLQGEDTLTGYQVSRLEHSLQSATRACRDGADTDWIVATLLHDIGDGLAPLNHDRFAAQILAPFVRDEITWVIAHHGVFQTVYYGHHYGWDRYAREQYADNIYYQSCVDFCARWDQSSFDPDYQSESLSFFEPLVREVFSRPAYDEVFIRKDDVQGLPEQKT